MSSVDVVVPCYNYGHYLQQCVNSVLSQERVDVRVLIIDDCSSDRTAEIGRRLAERDHRVIFTRHNVNRGHIATYNEGLLGWASADYSLLLSADDLLTPCALARAAALMDQHGEVGMSYGLVISLLDGEEPTLSHAAFSDECRVIPGTRFLKYCCDTTFNPVQTAAAVVRTEVQKRIGGYRNDLPHSGDFEMWMRFAVNGPVGVIHAIQGFYRQHSQNMSLSYYRGSFLRDSRERLQAFEAIFENWGPGIPNLADCRESLSKRLGEAAFWTASRAFDAGDKESFVACLAFAEEVCPKIRWTSMWARLRAKAFLGARTWRCIRPVLDRWRGLKHADARQDSKITAPSRLIGWWPG